VVALNHLRDLYLQKNRYQALGSPSKVEDNAHPVEMVTVPALGPEWGKREMRDMTKAGKAENRANARREYYQQWRRGERGIGGTWCTWKIFVFFCFGFIIA
jgi:hypothetical protein